MSLAKSDITVIVVAAGSGTRFGAPVPKQFCLLRGKPVLVTTLTRLAEALPSARFLLVLSADMVDEWQQMCRRCSFVSPPVVAGGATRWESVRNALASLPESADGTVMVHDGARPLVNASVVNALVEAVEAGAAGALPVLPVTDSIRRLMPDGASEAVDRSLFRTVQTPQAFRLPLIRQAYALPYSDAFTDDASVMEAAGFNDIVLVEGAPETLKITRPADLAVVDMLFD